MRRARGLNGRERQNKTTTSCPPKFKQHAMESFSLLDHPTSIQSLSSNLSDATRSHKPHHRPHRHHRHGKDAGQSASVSSRLKGASRSSPHSPTHNASGSNRSSVIRSEENGESIVPLRTLVRAEDVARERTHLKVQERYAVLRRHPTQ